MLPPKEAPNYLGATRKRIFNPKKFGTDVGYLFKNSQLNHR